MLHGLARFRFNEELERGTNFFLVRDGHLEESLPYVHTHNNEESGWDGGISLFTYTSHTTRKVFLTTHMHTQPYFRPC